MKVEILYHSTTVQNYPFDTQQRIVSNATGRASFELDEDLDDIVIRLRQDGVFATDNVGRLFWIPPHQFISITFSD